MIPSKKKAAPSPRATSPVADRIRAYFTELGYTQGAFSEALGWDRSQLSTILGRLDQGRNIRTDTLDALAKGMGCSRDWILTGEGPRAVALPALRDVPGWVAAREQAATRYGVAEAVLEEVGQWSIPSPPAEIDAPFVVALARALVDAQNR